METQKRYYLLVEFLVLFIIVPLSLVLDYPIYLKIFFTLLGFIYVLWVLYFKEDVAYNIKSRLPWKKFWKRVMITFICVALSTILYVSIMDPKNLFFVPRNHPLLFFGIMIVYTLLSAWPQEILYRTFFFKRYEKLFRSKWLLIIVNALLFSMAHLFFRNILVLLITFIGGVIFALSYLNFRSTTLVTIEHAIYGNWIYTVGLGYILDFPGFDN